MPHNFGVMANPASFGFPYPQGPSGMSMPPYFVPHGYPHLPGSTLTDFFGEISYFFPFIHSATMLANFLSSADPNNFMARLPMSLEYNIYFVGNKTDDKNLEVRLKEMEDKMNSFSNKSAERQVGESLAQVRILASRPNLTHQVNMASDDPFVVFKLFKSFWLYI
jgi:hypothetical protein